MERWGRNRKGIAKPSGTIEVFGKSLRSSATFAALAPFAEVLEAPMSSRSRIVRTVRSRVGTVGFAGRTDSRNASASACVASRTWKSSAPTS